MCKATKQIIPMVEVINYGPRMNDYQNKSKRKKNSLLSVNERIRQFGKSFFFSIQSIQSLSLSLYASFSPAILRNEFRS